MKYTLHIFLCFFSMITAVFPWGKAAHQLMTHHAAREILNPDSVTKIAHLDVKVDYELSMKFMGPILKGTNFIGTHGVLESFFGYILDETAFDKLAVNDTMDYKNMSLLEIIKQCGSDPDVFDEYTGVFGKGKATMGHTLCPNGVGLADVYVDYFYQEAVSAWKNKQFNQAYAYLAYASHYLEDAGIPLHVAIEFTDVKCVQWQQEYHTYVEDWINKEWNSRYNSIADSAAAVPMPACDIRAMVRALAIETYPDITEWTDSWGLKGGGDFDPSDPDYQNPVNSTRFDQTVKRCIWRTVPRVSGLFLKFKREVIEKK